MAFKTLIITATAAVLPNLATCQTSIPPAGTVVTDNSFKSIEFNNVNIEESVLRSNADGQVQQVEMNSGIAVGGGDTSEFTDIFLPDYDCVRNNSFVSGDWVEKKLGEQNFRVLSEMRILAKIRVVILDFGRVCPFFSEIWREIRF